MNADKRCFFAFDVGYSLFDIGYLRPLYPVIPSKEFTTKHTKGHEEIINYDRKYMA